MSHLSNEQVIEAQVPGIWPKRARDFVLSHLSKMPEGGLKITEPDGNEVCVGDMNNAAQLHMDDWRTYSMMLTGGALGAAEAYMYGFWQTPDLVGVVRYFARNINQTKEMDGGLARLFSPLRKLLHFFNRNSVAGSKRNIAAHYDLGNDFFSLFLDPTMMYSSAIWPKADASLDQAAVHKLDVICQKLQLAPEMTLLEIGTGWGGLAVHAAKYYGCDVVTTTISEEQYQYACQRVKEEKLEDKVQVLKKDYRLLTGKYDRVVSVEMIEAVGHQFLPQYFSCLNDRLNDNGLLLLQAITIPDQRYQSAVKNVDFIKRYIFPGGFLPSISVMHENLTKHTQLVSMDIEDIGLDYAQTLHEWSVRFENKLDVVRSLKFDDTFIRMWRYYLAYCEGAFRERAISTVHLLAAGPAWRP